MHLQIANTSIAHTVRPRRGAAVACVALACAGLLSACGSSGSTTSTQAKIDLNIAHVERSIEQSIFSQRHLKATVVCPAKVAQEAGKTFECVATTAAIKAPHGPVKTPFVVTVQNSKGYVTYVGK
jgi:hypothetical protein